jgi:tetratricopeptide (TPR) repeat protein
MPESPLALANRARLEIARRDFCAAANYYGKILEKKSNSADLYSRRGYALYKCNKLKESVADYTQAIRLNPKMASAYKGRGDVALAGNDLTAASEDYARAIEINANFGEAWNALGWVNHLKGDDANAIGQYTRAIELNQGDVRALALRNRALSYQASGEYRKAVEDVKKAIALGRANKSDYNRMGVANFKLREFDQSLVDFTQALVLDPDFRESLRNRSLVFLELGQEARACHDLQRLSHLSPRDTAIAKLGRRLRDCSGVSVAQSTD